MMLSFYRFLFLFLILSLGNIGMAWNGWIHDVVWVNLQNGSPSKHFKLLNDRQRLRVMDIYRIQSCELKLVLTYMHVCLQIFSLFVL
ncbi:hypothetical protein GGI43DRAFT_297992 [Trichoderma evansii]